MTIAQIEENIKKLLASIDSTNFIYEFLLAFGTPKATIARLQTGKSNLGVEKAELIWKKKLQYRLVATGTNLLELIQQLRDDSNLKKTQPRFIIVTDLNRLLSIDLQTQDTLDCNVAELDKHFDFFLPYAGIEKAQYLAENPADVKAAEKMAKLYEQINVDNEFKTEEEIHQLNVFLSRLLFCYFAEDTGIFEDKLFINAITSNTKSDASDTQEFLRDLFIMLNTDESERSQEKQYLHKFPYVNGGLFSVNYPIPIISVKSRNLILECGNLDWSAINPDIFGSMIQAVVTTDKRGGLGMHYTSVPNIMKVINPLFLNELLEEFLQAKGNIKQLNSLIERISKIKIFDPACGSGNFLIIAYKKLRELEIQILNELSALKGNKGSGTLDFGSFNSLITLNNFYGIEIDDFAHEIARLSLWLAEHQMNQLFRKEFGHSRPALPLKESGKIIRANACRVDWEEVCPKGKHDEIYILGNPPYLGTTFQDISQKEDIALVFREYKDYKKLDLICCWFYLASKYINNTYSKYAFVSTNSISQGEFVSIFWSKILSFNQEIFFTYPSFKWINNARNKAGVTVVIIGIRDKISSGPKKIYTNGIYLEVQNISPYLTNNTDLIIYKRSSPISKSLPKMSYGNKAVDGGHLILNDADIHSVKDKKLIKKLIGSNELINGKIRYCLWINSNDLNDALNDDFIKKRIEKVKLLRLKSKDKGANELANKSHQFRDFNLTKSNSIVVPRVSSENRLYLPIGIIDNEYVCLDSVQVVYDTDIFIFSILSSLIHNIWVKRVSGGLETRIGYSNSICYNAFPFPKISKEKERELEELAYKILEVRERYPEKTLAQLYDPNKMPEDLREAHRLNDLAVESCYRSKPFETDEERLEHLFKLYEKMIAAENKN